MPTAENPSINGDVEPGEVFSPEAASASGDDDFVEVQDPAVPVAVYALRKDLTLEQRRDFVLALIDYVTQLRQNGEICGELNLANVLVRYVTDLDDEALGEFYFEYRGQEPLDFDITSPSPSHQHGELTRKDCELLIGVCNQTFIELRTKIELAEKESGLLANKIAMLMLEKQGKELEARAEAQAIEDYDALSWLAEKLRKEIKNIEGKKSEINAADTEIEALNYKLRAIEKTLDPKYGKIPSFKARIQSLEGEIQALEEKIKAAAREIQEREQQTANNSITEVEEYCLDGLELAAKRAISPMAELSNIKIFLETKDKAKIPKRTRETGPEPRLAQSYGVMTGVHYFQKAESPAKKPATKTASPPPREMTEPQDDGAEKTYGFYVNRPGKKP